MTNHVQTEAQDILTKAHEHKNNDVMAAINKDRQQMTDPEFNELLKQIKDKDKDLKVVSFGDKSQVFLEMPSPFPFCKPNDQTMYNSDDYTTSKEIAPNQSADYDPNHIGEGFQRSVRVLVGQFAGICEAAANAHKGA